MIDTVSFRFNELHTGVRFKQYQLLEQIGVGGQGVVWSALDLIERRLVAIKLNEALDTDQEKIDAMQFEQQTGKLISLRHPHILPIFDFGIAGRIRYLVTSYKPGGSLRDRIQSGSFQSEDALQAAAEIAAALDYLHEQEVVHRDLKPSNILLDTHQHCYVADFGLARFLSDTTDILHTGRGTPPYAPPEQHAMGRMTPQSDVYNFGIMLYELFTLQLPWEGKKILGVQQLQSKEEIPDPVEINPYLPQSLVTVLRQMTDPNPAERQHSAGEATRMVYEAFNLPYQPVTVETQQDEATLNNRDAEELIKRSTKQWGPFDGTVAISLTKFAMIDLCQTEASKKSLPPDVQHFMLYHALTYGYNDDSWWKLTGDPDEKLTVVTALISKNIEAITARVVNRLMKDPELRFSESPIARIMTDSLLETASKSDDPWLRQQSLVALQALIPAAMRWREIALSPEQDRALAKMAISDPLQGDNAAILIGHLRSRWALQTILNDANENRIIPALLAVLQGAGNLPLSTPLGIHLNVIGKWIIHQLLARPLALLTAYGMALFGIALGFGTQVYLSYRLPDLFDNTRIKISLEQGIVMGAVLGFGLIITRVIAERFSNKNILIRIISATVTGGLVLNGGLYVYYRIFLNTPLEGVLSTAGCLLIALGFALGVLKSSRLWKIGTSFAAFFMALAGSWWGHIKLATTLSNLTPIFFYEYTWPVMQVLGMMFGMALLVAIFGNYGDLSHPEESRGI